MTPIKVVMATQARPPAGDFSSCWLLGRKVTYEGRNLVTELKHAACTHPIINKTPHPFTSGSIPTKVFTGAVIAGSINVSLNIITKIHNHDVIRVAKQDTLRRVCVRVCVWAVNHEVGVFTFQFEAHMATKFICTRQRNQVTQVICKCVACGVVISLLYIWAFK